MTEKEIGYRKRVIEYYRRVAEEIAPEKTRDAFLQRAQLLENELSQ